MSFFRMKNGRKRGILTKSKSKPTTRKRHTIVYSEADSNTGNSPNRSRLQQIRSIIDQWSRHSQVASIPMVIIHRITNFAQHEFTLHPTKHPIARVKKHGLSAYNRHFQTATVFLGDSFVMPSRCQFHCQIRINHISDMGGYIGIGLVPNSYNILRTPGNKLGYNSFVFYSYGRYYNFSGKRSGLKQGFRFDEKGCIVSITIDCEKGRASFSKLYDSDGRTVTDYKAFPSLIQETLSSDSEDSQSLSLPTLSKQVRSHETEPRKRPSFTTANGDLKTQSQLSAPTNGFYRSKSPASTDNTKRRGRLRPRPKPGKERQRSSTDALVAAAARARQQRYNGTTSSSTVIASLVANGKRPRSVTADAHTNTASAEDNRAPILKNRVQNLRLTLPASSSPPNTISQPQSFNPMDKRPVLSMDSGAASVGSPTAMDREFVAPFTPIRELKYETGSLLRLRHASRSAPCVLESVVIDGLFSGIQLCFVLSGYIDEDDSDDDDDIDISDSDDDAHLTTNRHNRHIPKIPKVGAWFSVIDQFWTVS